MKDLMKKYTRAFSVSGREASLAAQIAEDLRPFADSVSTDAMGNLIVLKKGKDGGKKLMLAAHMDSHFSGTARRAYGRNRLYRHVH